MIIELHLLQSFPTSNLNRDEFGQPKTVTFGGCTRSRISSQCLKRSARQELTKFGLDESEVGVRTKRLRDAAAEVLVERGRDADLAPGVAEIGLQSLGFGVKKNGLTEYLLFVGQQSGGVLADFCDREWDKLAEARAKAEEEAERKRKKKGDGDSEGENVAATAAKKVKPTGNAAKAARDLLDARRAADVALFGRMIADNKDFNVNAASQVAHAISTHSVANEFDYYTAVDDLKPDAEAGADMIGDVGFNAACYYRYANLDLEQLTKNLGGDDALVERAAKAWLHAFINAVPTGKQNSMAARTMPETLLGVVRDSGAWNLANAFLKPVDTKESASDGVMVASSRRLGDHFDKLRRFYGATTLRTVIAASLNEELQPFGPDETAADLDAFTAKALNGARG
ncbi:type I-E CRISPR-associated protein Cas7/Cse4/CasC [Actinoallomurus liliacearum]|uniref:Type I-E CRISPR-associated protein Cas7/Cse4/CasC n=1 Tax=Actinoallomurus liliacearum TaxID=1080073 RepID=A0ABP8TGL8_9ACTN